MARPRLPIGTWGEVWTTATPSGRVRAVAKFRDLDGITREVSRVGRSKAGARTALVEHLRERARVGAGAEITGDSLVAEVLNVWHEQATPQLATQTRRRYREMIDTHLVPGLRQVTVREATVSRLDQLLKAITRDSGPGTARLCRSVLSGAMGMAVRHGAATANPVRDTAPVNSAKGDGPRALTLDQVGQLRRAAVAWEAGQAYAGLQAARMPWARRNSDIVDVVDMLLGTGARIGEVLAITWPQVDLEQATVTIAGTIIHGDQGVELQPTPKSAAGWRTLQLPGFAMDTLLRRRVTESAGTELQLVFPSTAGTPRDPNNARATLRRIRAAVGLDWVTPHTFRRTVATLVDAEDSLRSAAAQLGHSGTTVTSRHYIAKAHAAPDLRPILEALAPPAELAREAS